MKIHTISFETPNVDKVQIYAREGGQYFPVNFIWDNKDGSVEVVESNFRSVFTRKDNLLGGFIKCATGAVPLSELFKLESGEFVPATFEEITAPSVHVIKLAQRVTA